MENKLSDPGAERALLAGLFHYGADALADISDLIQTGDLTEGIHQVIFSCVGHFLANSPTNKIDVPSILSAANTLGLRETLENLKNLKYLMGITRMPVEKENLRKFAGKLRKLGVARELTCRLDRAKADLESVTGDESIEEILGRAEGPLFDLTAELANTSSQGITPMGEGALEYVRYLMDNPREMVGIRTGFSRYDEVIGGGLRADSFNVVVARQKSGKSFMADNVSINICKLGIPVLNIDTEMGKEKHINRVCANLASLQIKNIEKGKYGADPTLRQKLENAAIVLKNLPYDYCCARGKSFHEIVPEMRRWVLRKVGLGEDGKARPCVIIYDWLKISSPSEMSKSMAEHQLLGFIASSLKDFMGQYGVACLCFAQANRDGIDKEDTSVIRASDRILDFCTSFTIFKKKTPEERAEERGAVARYSHKLIPKLTRDGELLDDEDYINVETHYDMGRMIEGPTRNELGGVRARGQFVVEDDE